MKQRILAKLRRAVDHHSLHLNVTGEKPGPIACSLTWDEVLWLRRHLDHVPITPLEQWCIAAMEEA